MHTPLQPSGYYRMRGLNTAKGRTPEARDAHFYNNISMGHHALHAAMLLHEAGDPEAAVVHHKMAEHFHTNAALEHNHLSHSSGATEQTTYHRKEALNDLGSHAFEVGKKTREYELSQKFAKADEPATDFRHMLIGLHRSR